MALSNGSPEERKRRWMTCAKWNLVTAEEFYGHIAYHESIEAKLAEELHKARKRIAAYERQRPRGRGKVAA